MIESNDTRTLARTMVEGLEMQDLCDLYAATSDLRKTRVGDDRAAASVVFGWIVSELERRDPDATVRWCDAEDAAGADLSPHPFFGCTETQGE